MRLSVIFYNYWTIISVIRIATVVKILILEEAAKFASWKCDFC